MNKNKLITVEGNELVVATELWEKYLAAEMEILRLKNQQDKFKETLKTAMEEYGVKSWNIEGVVSAIYVEASTAQIADSAKLKKDGLFDKYSKESKRKSSVRVTCQ